MPDNKALLEAIDVLKDAASGYANATKVEKASDGLLDILLTDRALPAKVRLYLEIQEIRRGFHDQARIRGLLALFGRLNDPIPRRRRLRSRSRKRPDPRR
ncbi:MULTISPECIES: hypothetical protein [Microvirga]|uniref:hypothetical protein n=1 Tax=Microvirga TaxID=186650 RepID=UPI0021C87D1C|nr:MULTISPECIES: hypothetical protein [unclassified Microvirga]